MDLNLHSDAGTIQVSDTVFGVDSKPALVHQVITAYMSGARAGTKAQKSRSAVNGGGAKPFRQKGTGRARAGTARSPIWRSGGRAFAAHPRNYEQKVNRKMYRGAIRAILSDLVRDGRLLVVKEFALAEPKTKQLVAKLHDMELTNTLVVTEGLDENLMLASRNLPTVDVIDVTDLDPISLIAFDKVLITEASVKMIEERLA